MKMRKIFWLMPVITLLLLAAACSKPSNSIPVPEDTSANQSMEEDQLIENTDSTGDFSGDEFAYQYWGNVNNLALIIQIVGGKETTDFAEGLIDSLNGKKVPLPFVYMAIKYFDIAEETFREYNNITIELNNRHGTTNATYTDWEVEVLYCGDEAEIMRQFKSPYAFFDGSEVFTLYDVLAMEADDMAALYFDLDALFEYCDWVQGEVNVHPHTDKEYFQEKFNDFSRKRAAAQMMRAASFNLVEPEPDEYDVLAHDGIDNGSHTDDEGELKTDNERLEE
jgi:hypothetical protein